MQSIWNMKVHLMMIHMFLLQRMNVHKFNLSFLKQLHKEVLCSHESQKRNKKHLAQLPHPKDKKIIMLTDPECIILIIGMS